ncbi:tetratricopeptide repeat protein [Methanosarcina sp.]|uniref:tetratricopeptide repeat protein n=1 Tax=Methanosarcina sp. TaxID=2213 RepID=UPI003BB72BFD
MGAGCSVSSGIDAAGTLVDTVWLPKLQELETGTKENFNEWLKINFPTYNKNDPAKFYGKVIESLFPTEKERQKEIERLVGQNDPGFGYAVLAQLMAGKYGEHCNIILTTNFDDMVADALYLYTNKKPIVIFHESFAGFVKISDKRPIVIKLHGDSKLPSRNTNEETSRELDTKIKEVLKNLFSETGLIFIGYSGNDNSIINILNEIPENEGFFPWGIYWVGQRIPDSNMKEFLKTRKAIQVTHKNFDELMILIKEELKFELPTKDRFVKLFDNLSDTFKTLRANIDSKPDSIEKRELKKAIEKASQEFEPWWAVELEASKYKITDPKETEQIYQNGINQFPDSHQLLGNYGNFLVDVRKDYKKAEEMYIKALEISPEDATYLGNYAIFLFKVRKDYDKAEEMYIKALEIEPEDANNLDNYGTFLLDVRKDYDKAEEMYRKALEIDPENANCLGNYAFFLKEIRKNYDKTGELYIKALEIEPENVNNLENYANFLRDVLKDYGKAEDFYIKALEIEPENTNNLGDYANFQKIIRKDYNKAEELYRKVLKIRPEHAGNLGNYALFLYEIRKDYDKAEELYIRALKIEPEKANTLGNYANFLTDVRKDYEKAEEMYKKALEIDPEHANNLGNYANFLYEIRKDYDKAEEYYKKALKVDPEDATHLSNYANFLKDVRKDYKNVEEIYKKVLEIEPNDANNLDNCKNFLIDVRKNYEKEGEIYRKDPEVYPENVGDLGNCAGLLLARGNERDGFDLLNKAIPLASRQVLLLECWFYCYAHAKNEKLRNQSLGKIRDLIVSGVRYSGLNLEENVKTAIKNGHSEPEFLEKLSRVISDEIDAEELDGFIFWWL